ncbi:unnamed protein product [Dracunculus medinensis]|uniref:Protein phosphatase 1 regulatory subunit 21 n=1 Tax=Dracunculus medinensis TaxID=318479 RepID=A0A0N4U109_DRAME|nr:unnamed protein product [Dracunculus medinensis]
MLFVACLLFPQILILVRNIKGLQRNMPRQLRAQVNVLKNAVIEEQSKNRNNLEELHAKETSLRKLTIENESLEFRNAQLLKRVECLLAEINTVQQPSSKKQSGSRSVASRSVQPDFDKCLLKNELADKVRENEALHSKVSELESAHEEKLLEINKTVNSIKAENDFLRGEIDRLTKQFHKNSISHFYISQPSSLQPDHQQEQNELGISKDIDEVKATNRVLQLDSARTIFSLVTSFINLLQLFEQRSSIYPNDMTMEKLPEVTVMLGTSLLKSVELFKNWRYRLEEALDICNRDEKMDITEKYFDTLPFLIDAVDSNKNWIQLFNDRIEQENRLSWSGSNLCRCNLRWGELVTELVMSLDHLCAELSNGSNGSVVRSLDQIKNIFSECCKIFTAKLFDENRLPTACKRLRCINECIEKCLRSILKNLSNLTSLLELFDGSNCAFRSLSVQKSADDSLEIESQTGFRYIFKQTSSDMSPFGPLFEKRSFKAADSPGETASLSHDNLDELQRVKQQLVDVEMEKERYRVDVEVLTRKLNRHPCDGNCCGGALSDELELLQAYYENRIRNLLLDLKFLEGKSVYYKNECEDLLRASNKTLNENKELTRKLILANEQIALLNDDLNTTRKGYEDQMRLLYEHLGKLNATISDQSNIVSSVNSSNGIGNIKQVCF